MGLCCEPHLDLLRHPSLTSGPAEVDANLEDLLTVCSIWSAMLLASSNVAIMCKGILS